MIAGASVVGAELAGQVRHGVVEAEPAVVPQSQHRCRRERLRHRGDAEHGPWRRVADLARQGEAAVEHGAPRQLRRVVGRGPVVGQRLEVGVHGVELHAVTLACRRRYRAPGMERVGRPSTTPARGVSLPRTTEDLVRDRVKFRVGADRLRRLLPGRDDDGLRLPQGGAGGARGVGARHVPPPQAVGHPLPLGRRATGAIDPTRCAR